VAVEQLEVTESPEQRSVWDVLKDIETRVRRLEKLVWSFGGAVAVLQLLRACG
jgi:hypothetical protein